jgi:hypothetical protein
MQSAVPSSIDKQILRNLSRRTAWPWLKDALLDWLVIACTVAIVHKFANPLTGLLALLIIGNRQHALAILGHDRISRCRRTGG